MSLITIPVIENSIDNSNFVECNCCMENKNIKDIVTCCKNHNICKSCMKKMNRTDCLICNPLQKNIKINNIRENLSLYNCLSIILNLLFSFIMSNIIIAFCILLLAYIGKVYIYIYFKINSSADNSWFGWDKFNYILGETILGFFGSLIIGGCFLNTINLFIHYF